MPSPHTTGIFTLAPRNWRMKAGKSGSKAEVTMTSGCGLSCLILVTSAEKSGWLRA